MYPYRTAIPLAIAFICFCLLFLFLFESFGSETSMDFEYSSSQVGGPLYSSYQCIGETLSEGRACKLNNVCFSGNPRRISFFWPFLNETDQFHFKNSWHKEFSEDFVKIRFQGDEYVSLDDYVSLDVVDAYLNSAFGFHPAQSAVYMSPYLPVSFGHVIGIDMFAAYKILRLFGVSSKDVQILFAKDCSGNTCHIFQDVLPVVSKYPILTLGKSLSVSQESPVCFRDLYLGTSGMGYLTDRSDMWSRFVDDVVQFLGFNPIDSPPHPHIVIFLKSGPGSTKNIMEIAEFLSQSFSGVEVSVVDLSNLPFKEQIRIVRSASVIISNSGISMIAAFGCRDSVAILMDYFDTDCNCTGRLDVLPWDFNRNVHVLTYPLERHEITVEIPAGANVSSEHNAYRDYGTITVDVNKLRPVVAHAIRLTQNFFEN
eukprot:GILI01017235.1.p1 GENE.GILI01017235.1~~GILI01017235.1.p1  ORF type:complete len:427 (-),score=6.67 GILI01017235.1:495-1775(-)